MARSRNSSNPHCSPPGARATDQAPAHLLAPPAARTTGSRYRPPGRRLEQTGPPLASGIDCRFDRPVGRLDPCPGRPRATGKCLAQFRPESRDAMPEGGRLHIAARPVELAGEAAPSTSCPAATRCSKSPTTAAAWMPRRWRGSSNLFTTKRFGLGSGLGLSMAYGFVKQSGGGISIQSQPGQGTTVLMVLPLTTRETEGGCRRNHSLPLAANWCCSSRTTPTSGASCASNW